MNQSRTLLFLTLLCSALVLGLHLAALQYNFYWSLEWFDSVIHFLGGLTISFSALFLLHSYRPLIPKVPWQQFAFSFLIVFVVAVCWEIFELVNGLATNPWKGYWVDTISDICFGCLGSIVGACVSVLLISRGHE